MNKRFLEIARDTRLIPGVHHYCDEWCQYCPATERCLAFRCTRELRRARRRREGDPTFDTLEEAVAFTRDVAALEGKSTPELDALISHPPGKSGIDTSDPLAGEAWAYSKYAWGVVQPFAAEVLGAAHAARPKGPTPAEIVTYYHTRIYMSIFRALVARDRAARSEAERREEAAGSAKLALVCIMRSLGAAARLKVSSDERAELARRLERLKRGLEERFPGARRFVRIGLDVPAAA